MTSAPASAKSPEGGWATHKSSQISNPAVNSGEILTAKQQFFPKGHGLAAEGHFPGRPGAGSKVALFIKFTVVGDVQFRHQPQQLPLREHSGAVIKFPFPPPPAVPPPPTAEGFCSLPKSQPSPVPHRTAAGAAKTGPRRYTR